jgi:hypothetical protein
MHRFIFVSTQATSVGLLSGPHGLLFLYLSPDLVGIMLFMWRTFISQKKKYGRQLGRAYPCVQLSMPSFFN